MTYDSVGARYLGVMLVAVMALTAGAFGQDLRDSESEWMQDMVLVDDAPAESNSSRILDPTMHRFTLNAPDQRHFERGAALLASSNLRLSLDDPPADGDNEKPSGDDSAHLAQKLQNPVADLITVPFQFNFNFGGGVDAPPARLPKPIRRILPGPISRGLSNFLLRARQDDRDQASQYILNFQPVVPISLSDDWNLISRTILPVVYQDQVFGTSEQGGLGDTLQSFFFSPKTTEPFIWGVGPVFLFPTATDDMLGAKRWGMGPTGVILKQDGQWTYGILANHIWSFARDDDRNEVNATFLQPFLSYTFKSALNIGLNTESTYDWIEHQWTVPIQAQVSQLVKIGKQPVNFALAGRYWAEAPDSAPTWGIRLTISLLFPK